MPELPELELARRDLERWLAGRRVVKAEAEPGRTFRGARRGDFEQLSGRLVFARRKGKYLLLGFEKNRGLLVHLGMTGKLVRRPTGRAEPYGRARLFLDDGSVIHLRDPRLFGRVETAPADALDVLPVIRRLGPDALTDAQTPRRLEQTVGRTDRELKVALMDQSRLSGLGNLHAAEALFRARLHPRRRTSSIDPREWRRLATAIRATLAFAIDEQSGDELRYVEEPGARNPFFVYGRAGEECRRCGATVGAFRQGGRTTFFCPGCQPEKGSRR